MPGLLIFMEKKQSFKMINVRIISVDFQKDFSDQKGKHYKPRKSVDFVKNTLVPYLREKDIKIAEIISDYRLPRPADPDDSCRVGEWGYESEIPEDVKLKPQWVKCMNSPIWVRDNIGNPNKKPGLPYQDPQAFTKWLHEIIGKPDSLDAVVLIGLTADCCVFCTAQELSWRGYNVKVLSEGVGSYSGSEKEKEMILTNRPFTNWAESISWKGLQKLLK